MRKWIGFFSILLFLVFVSGCNKAIYNQTESNVADVKERLNEARQKSDSDALNNAPMVMKRGMYVDTQPISLYRDPYWLNNQIVIRGDQLPFSYYSRTIGNGAGRHILTRYQNGLDQTIPVSVNYSGSVRGALDLLATKTGFVYSIQGNSIYWQAFLTKTIDVAFMPGGSDYLMGQSSQGATSSGAGASNTGVTSVVTDSTGNQFSNQAGKLSIWKDLESTIKQILSSEGKVMVSESTTSVTVRDRPSNVKLVEQYVANLNHNLSKQVLVKIQVLEIDLNNDFNYGINWGIIANAFHHTPFVLNANYGTPVAIIPLVQANAIAQASEAGTAAAAVKAPTIGFSGAGIPSYTVLVNALQQQGKVSVVSEPRVVCLNNQVSTIRITDQQGYLAEIQNTTVAGLGGNIGSSTITSQVTPGVVITGITLYILPKILGDKIYLQVNADLSNNLGFQEIGTGGTNGQSIQVPHLTAKHFNQRSVITSGSTLILSGFRKLTNQTGAMQFFDQQALGGKASTEKNSETIVLITPIILHGTA